MYRWALQEQDTNLHDYNKSVAELIFNKNHQQMRKRNRLATWTAPTQERYWFMNINGIGASGRQQASKLWGGGKYPSIYISVYFYTLLARNSLCDENGS